MFIFMVLWSANKGIADQVDFPGSLLYVVKKQRRRAVRKQKYNRVIGVVIAIAETVS